ncbi:MAG: hypothetical protein OXG65_13510 [Chloroflexi bacterium]|nr:hypothetical protein [Chloroflexota bacterium]
MGMHIKDRLVAGLRTAVTDERGNATEYIVIAGIGVAVFGAAIVAWNNGLSEYLAGVLRDLAAL